MTLFWIFAGIAILGLIRIQTRQGISNGWEPQLLYPWQVL